MSGGFWILREGSDEPIQVTSAQEWARWFEDVSLRRVGDDTIGDARVSTVFLGVDYSFDGGPPVLWETVVFGGEHDDYGERYTSAADARAGHARICAMVRGEEP
jgi:hypothetical protein